MFKKSVAAVLAAVLVLSCAACDRSAPEIKSTGENTSTYAGVSVQILYVETTEEETVLHVQWQNGTSYSILYGEAFALQRWEQGRWVDCPMKENTGFITIGYQLEPGQSLTKPYTLNWAFGKLAAGHYRFITACNVMLSGEDEDCKLSAEFDIGESMDNGADLQGEFTEPPKLYIAGEVVLLNAEQANTVCEILYGITYDQNLVCDCQPEYQLTLPNGATYGIHLEEGYVSNEEGLAKLSEKQLEDLSAIIDWALEKTKAK